LISFIQQNAVLRKNDERKEVLETYLSGKQKRKRNVGE